MKIELTKILCAILTVGVAIGAESSIKLDEDESTSLARFEMIHRLACDTNDSEMFMLLLPRRERNNLLLLNKNKLQEVINKYPEVTGVSLVLELSREDYIKLVGARVADHWVDSEEVNVRYFKVEFKLKNNGSAQNYVILKNGIFYKAAL